MAPSSASNKTPSHDEDPIRKQLKILSPLPHVPWDHPPPLATGAGKGNSPASSRHRHGNQAGNDRSSDGVYRRTRARSQKRISFGDGSSFSSHQQQQEEEEEDRVRQKVGKQQRRTGMPAYMYLSRYDAPSYLVGNPYIHGGYRACRTLRESCQGLFYYHNSWLDTWTSCFSWIHAHVLLAVAVWRYGAFDQDWLSAFVFGLFYVHVAWVHAPASIVCHLVGNAGISQHVYELCLEIDYLGIFSASVILSFTQAVFVYPAWATCVNVAMALSLTAYLIAHLRQVVVCHIGRLRMLLEIGSLYQFPLWYQAYLDCASSSPSLPPTLASSLHPSLPISLLCAVGTTGSLVMGGLTYALHFPECFAPGKFDVWWNSHAVMHVWINVAMFSEFAFLVHMLTRRHA